MRWTTGAQYIGDFKAGLRDGKDGKYKFPDGCVFRGDFKKDRMIKGTLIYPDGSSFRGRFEGGVVTQGTKIYPNGDFVEGIWKRDTNDGNFTFTLLKRNGKKSSPPINEEESSSNDEKIPFSEEDPPINAKEKECSVDSSGDRSTKTSLKSPLKSFRSAISKHKTKTKDTEKRDRDEPEVKTEGDAEKAKTSSTAPPSDKTENEE